MRAPLVLVTGFGPFRDVRRNPSGELALALAAAPPEGLAILARILPVSFRGAPRALRAALEGWEARAAALLLGLGVQRQPWFRPERRARARPCSAKPDARGVRAAELEGPDGPELETALDLAACAAALRAGGAPDVRVSDDAGGYVCEHTYRALLEEGAARGLPALFLHVPPVDVLETREQLGPVRALLVHLARELSPRAPG